jgi:hypothetical protein
MLYFTTSFAFAQDNSAAHWTTNNITTDGNANDWQPPLKHYDNQTKLFFDFKNDSNNLYLCFQTKDEMNQAKILGAGMKIILSGKMNGKHKSIINFPLGVKNSQIPKTDDEVQPDPLAAHESKHAIFLARDTAMEVKGFVTQNGLIGSNNASGIRAAINWNAENTLTYEVAIPLKELFGEGYDLKDLSKEISLNVVINGMSVNDAKKHSANGYGERRGNGEGRTNNGSGAMDNEARMAAYNTMLMSQKTELKQKFVLSLAK